MASMLLIGLGLMTGVMIRLAAFGGIAWLAIFYLATAIWPENNPFVDEHVIYAVVLIASDPSRTQDATGGSGRCGSAWRSYRIGAGCTDPPRTNGRGGWGGGGGGR